LIFHNSPEFAEQKRWH